ncbi:MAG TPA: PD-(D/E)XK nuclease family protein, partial [Rhabdochlamydiaceae bacterium]|nr:PD-(D/E)XK nuclease family protein [Rhabdochlamydiaceae bacterium]
SFLELLSTPSKPELLGKVMFSGFLGIDPIDVSKALEKANKEKVPLVDIVKISPELSEFYKKLSHLSRIAANESAVKGFEKIARESGFFEFMVKHPRAHELFVLYDGLLQTVIRFAERRKAALLNDFVGELLKAGEYSKDILVSKIPPDGVELMTAHGSKGLEFDYVFIVNTNEGIWSGRKAHKAFFLPTGALKDAIEDERRLFYVALTRARKGVWATYAKRGMDGKELSPSRFLYEMGENVEDIKDVQTVLVTEKTDFKRTLPLLIKDKAYLNKLFIERGFPVTHLNNFLDCPWRYFFTNLLRVPTVQDNTALYGSAMHNALKDYFNAYAREEDISINKTIQLFESYLQRTHMTEKDLEVFAKSGAEELRGYLSQANFSRSIFNEFTIMGVPFPVGGVEIVLNGKLDKVEVLGSGGVNVVDYKTGKPKSRNEIMGQTKNADGNYKRQLVFYKLLLNEYKRGEWNMKTGTIDFIKPDDRGKLHHEVFVIEDKEIEELKVLVKDTAQKILDLSFVNENCDDEYCEWCRLGKGLGQ